MLPLEGIRILAVSQFGAGPYGTLHLADLGAEIIKIEDPAAGGDVARSVPPYAEDGDSLYFQAFNRNKRSLTLNLAGPAGQAVLHDLVAVSDGLFSNLRGDQPERLGLTYAHLAAVNPRIVCCALTGYGRTGPRRDEPGYDSMAQAYAGLMSLTGEPEAPPTRSGVPIVDYAGGLTAVLGLVCGLLAAQRTGKGGDVDVSLLDTAVGMLSYVAAWTLNRDYQPRRMADSAHPTLVPCQTFATADGHLTIMCAKEHFWRALTRALDAPELAEEPRYRAFADRYRHREELIARLKAIFVTRPTAAWLERLRGQVPCAPVNDVAAALADEQVLARQMVIEVEHPRWGTLRQVGAPIKVDGGESPRRPAPALGADTDEILRTYLGYTPARIAALRADGVI